MKEYKEMKESVERVDVLTQEWLEFCERDHKIHVALGIISAITYVVGMIGILNI